jgi:hypothetical protein
MRFSDAGAAIEHVPHVLYHWRTHAASLSHSGTQNQGSIVSSRHVLQRVVNKQPRPELYELRPFPLFRGAEDWYVARREMDRPRTQTSFDRTTVRGAANHRHRVPAIGNSRCEDRDIIQPEPVIRDGRTPVPSADRLHATD